MVAGFAVGFVASAGVGLSLGLVGAGGSILTIPILVYLLGMPVADAIGMSLAVVAATSLFGAALQLRAGQVDLQAAALFGGAGALGALLGARLTHLATADQMMVALGLLMILASVVMLVWRQAEATRSGMKIVKGASAGFVVGLVTGFLGVGGGFLIVPALLVFGGQTARKAIGTSLLVIAGNSIVGLIAASRHANFHPPIVATVALAAVVGMVLGSRVAPRISPQRLRRGFAVVALATATFVLVSTTVT